MSSWQGIARRIRVPLGFVFAALYVWLAHPSWPSIFAGSSIAVIGLIIRASPPATSARTSNSRPQGPMLTPGTALYLGSLIIALGFTLASRSWIIGAIAAALLVGIYVPVIRSEERFLRALFPQFDDYCQDVPRLFPRWPAAQGSSGAFSADLFWKHREYKAALGAAAIIAVLVLKVLWTR
jgi:hypothetical protein